MLRDRGVNARLALCLNSVLNVKAVVAAFNQEKALVKAFSVIVKTDCETDGSFYSTNENSRHCCPAEKTYLQCSRSKLTPLPTPSNCLALVSKTET